MNIRSFIAYYQRLESRQTHEIVTSFMTTLKTARFGNPSLTKRIRPFWETY
jgi:hypothetical protein